MSNHSKRTRSIDSASRGMEERMATEIRKGWTDADLYEFAQAQLHELGDEGLILRPRGISEQRFERILSEVLGKTTR